MLDAQRLREPIDLAADEPDAGPLPPDRDDAQPPPRGRSDHPIRRRMVGRDHGGTVRCDDALEQDQLGGEISLLGRVVVHVVARQVGEATDRHAHAVDAVLIEPVRGGFHREMRDAVFRQPVERASELDRIGRRERAVDLLFRRHQPDGADARRLVAQRLPDLPREGRNRRLAAGAGHRRDRLRLPRMEPRRHKRERAAHIVRAHESDVRPASPPARAPP